MVSKAGALDITVRRLNGADPRSLVVALITPTHHHCAMKQSVLPRIAPESQAWK